MAESETYYRTLYEQSFDAILLTGPDGNIYSANPAACKMFQRTEEDICKIGRNGLVDINDPRLPSLLEERKRIGRASGELTMIRKDGTKFEVELSSSVFRDIGGQLRTSMVIRDITDRKRVEKEIIESRELFQKTFELSLIPNALSKLQGRIVVNVNTAFENLFGYTRSELIGKPITDFDLWEKAEVRNLAFEILIKQGELLNYEFSFKTKSGKTGFGIIYAYIIELRGEKYNLIKIVDITERKLVEKELAKSEEFLRRAEQVAHVGYWSRDILSGEIECSDETYRIFGLEPQAEKMNLKKLSGHIHPEDRLKVATAIQDAVAFIKPYDQEYRTLRPDDTVRWVHSKGDVSIDKEGHPFQMFGVILDITERKHTEEELHEGELQLESALKASDTGLWDWDLKTNKVFFSPEWEKQIGYEEHEISNDFSEWQNRVHPDDFDRALSTVQKFIESPYPNFENEFRFQHKDGSYRWILAKASIIFDQQGKPWRMLGSHLDITERRKAEEELRNSKELLESLSRRLINIREEERAMIAMNLHDDIGQKLTALNLNITWLKSRIGVQSKVVKEKLEEMNLMIKETIDGVQDFSSNLRPAILFDLGPAAAFDSFLKKFEKQSGIKCHFYHESEVSEIENEISIMLYRILQESMTNIARHSGATTAEVTLRTVKNRIELVIKDNGVGIDIAKTGSTESMGIAGIKERVKMLNGKVLIKGEKNHGTTIRVTVPIKNVSNYD